MTEEIIIRMTKTMCTGKKKCTLNMARYILQLAKHNLAVAANEAPTFPSGEWSVAGTPVYSWCFQTSATWIVLPIMQGSGCLGPGICIWRRLSPCAWPSVYELSSIRVSSGPLNSNGCLHASQVLWIPSRSPKLIHITLIPTYFLKF